MRKIFLVFVLWLGTQAIASAQDLDKLSATTCDCITKKSTETTTEPLDVNLLMQQCVLEAIMNDPTGIDMNNIEKMQEFGMQLALKLSQKCPAFTKLSMQMAQQQSGGNNFNKIEIASTTTGDFVSMESKGYTFITLANGGVNEKFLVLERFEGAESILGKEKTLKGKKMEVKWKEIEIYMPATKTYQKVKEILGVTLK